MRSFIQRLFDSKGGAVKRSKKRPRLQVEVLEDRITPIIAVLVGSSLEVTSAAIALPPPTAGPQQVMLEIDGTMDIGSATGGAGGGKASFGIENVTSFNLGPGNGESSVKVPFDEAIELTLAGVTESAEIKGDAVVSLKIDGSAEVASFEIKDAATVGLDGAVAEGDLTLHGAVSWSGPGDEGPEDEPPSVSFDEAASLTSSQNGVVSEAGGIGAGKGITFADGWRTALTGPASDYVQSSKTALMVDDATVLSNVDRWDITPAAPSASTSTPSSLMLDGTESFSLNVMPASEATANMEYKERWESVGDVTSLKYDGPIYMNFGTATATQQARLQWTGASSDDTYATDITLTPDDPSDLASAVQHIECANGDHITLTVDDTVDLLVAGLELPTQTHQTETGDVISIEIDSLLSKPGPGPCG